LIEYSRTFRVAGEAATAGAAVSLAAALRPDLALLDARLPDGDGIILCGQLKSANPGLLVIILTAYQTPFLVESALREGADGIILKTIDGEGMLDAIRAVFLGKCVVDPALVSSFAEGIRGKSRDLRGNESENRLLGLLRRGLTNKEIAHELGIKEKTVRNRLSALYRKLGVGNRTEAALLDVGTFVPTNRDK